jgi:hypothetical protein
MSKSTAIASAYSPSELPMGACPARRSSLMCVSSFSAVPLASIGDLRTWLQGAFPARTSVARARVRGSRGPSLGSGSPWLHCFAWFDRAGCSWKTPQCSLFGGLAEFSEAWPDSGLMRLGRCMPLPTWVRRTRADVSGLLATPTATANQLAPSMLARWPSCRALLMTGERGEAPLELGGGLLNPRWQEWLMGWPIGWTSSGPLETDRFRQWLSSHGAS